MFGLVDCHVVTDTISLGSIPGEGVGRSGALPGISSGSSPIPHGSWLPNALKARLTDRRGNGAPTYTGNPELWSVSHFFSLFFQSFFFFPVNWQSKNHLMYIIAFFYSIPIIFFSHSTTMYSYMHV